jgi:hypothetical protein
MTFNLFYARTLVISMIVVALYLLNICHCNICGLIILLYNGIDNSIIILVYVVGPISLCTTYILHLLFLIN